MAIRKANAEWRGSLQGGDGTMSLQSGAYEGPYSFSSRFEEGTGSNPEELIAAAHAGCFSMALSGVLGAQGVEPESIRTEAAVQILKEGEGFAIKKIELTTSARVPASRRTRSSRPSRPRRRTARCPSRSAAVDSISVNATLES